MDGRYLSRFLPCWTEVHSMIFCILLLNIPCPPEYVFCVGAKVPSALLAVDTRRPIIVRKCAMRSACFFSTFVLSSLPTSSLILAWFSRRGCHPVLIPDDNAHRLVLPRMSCGGQPASTTARLPIRYRYRDKEIQ